MAAVDLRHSVYLAARDGRSISVFAYLLESSKQDIKEILSTVTEEEDQKTTPLIIAARNGHNKVVKLLVEKYGCDIEQTGTVKFDGFIIEGATALWCAAGAGHFELVKMLLHWKADVNHATFSNSTPLRAACFDGRLDIVEYLIDHNANVHIPNKYNNTCLMIAAYKGHVEVVSHLLKRGADPNITAKCGATALHFAAERGHLDVVRSLTESGAVSQMNDQKMTPMMIAAECGKGNIVEYFISTQSCSKLQKIEALELLGASYANDKDNYDISKCYHYMWLAMQERFSDCENQLPKEVLPPITAYGNRVECQSVDELEAIENNSHLLHMEALTARERILGKDNIEIPHAIVFRGAVFADSGQFEQCILLWLRVLELRQNNDRMAGRDLLRFGQVFSQMIFTGAKVKFVDVEEVFKRSLTEIDCVQQRITKRKSQPGITKEEADLAEDMLEMTIHSMLYLLAILCKIKETEEEDFRLCKLTYCLNRKKLVLRSKHNYTLLHMVCDEDTVVDDFHVNDVISFPNDDLVKLLIRCGANVHAVDSNKNTALHIIAKYSRPISDLKTFHEIIVALIDAGVHVDRGNESGATAKDISAEHGTSTKEIIEILFRARGSLSLKCAAARVIKKFKLPYHDLVPVTLEDFIEIH